MRVAALLAAGIVAALAMAGFRASASNTSVSAVDRTGWNPAAITIHVGDSVTWSNGTPYPHNVCIASAGAAFGCDEYRSGAPSTSWPSGEYSHAFAAAGSYSYKCELHPAMTGTITVQGQSAPSGTGTGTSTYPPAETQPTDTTTTQTETQQAPIDTTAPRFTGKLKRRSSRKAVILD